MKKEHHSQSKNSQQPKKASSARALATAGLAALVLAAGNGCTTQHPLTQDEKEFLNNYNPNALSQEEVLLLEKKNIDLHDPDQEKLLNVYRRFRDAANVIGYDFNQR